MIDYMYKNLLLLGIILLLFLAKPQGSFAQQPGITVFPSIIHLDLEVDSPEYLLTYINNTDTEINLLLTVQDFTELEDSYKINFIEGKDAKNYKYSLSSWISFENRTIQLSPGEEKSVRIFIDSQRITKGGHYASILAEIVQPDNEKVVNVKGVLSSLLFVRASTGQEIEEGKISSFRALRDFFEYPDAYRLSFENSGNVHVVPYGLIEVYDPLGNMVGKGAFNEDSLDALPESIRRYDTKVNTYQKILLPGIYTANISLHFGKSNAKLESSVKFFSQGGLNLVTIGVTSIIIVLIVFYYFKKIRQKHE